MACKRNLMLAGVLVALVLSSGIVQAYGGGGNIGFKASPKQANGKDLKPLDMNGTITANFSFVGAIVVIDESGKLTEDAVKVYREEINLSEETPIDEVVVKKVMYRKVSNSQNYAKLKRMVKDIPDEKKQALLDELVGMDEEFTSKLSDDCENDPEAKQKVNNYIDVVGSKEPVRPVIKRNSVKELLTGKMGIGDFVKQILF